MRKIRYFARLILALVFRFKWLFSLGIVFGVVFFVVIRLLSSSILTRRIETIGVTGRHTPNNLPPQILSMLGDGLTKIDDTNLPEPAIAASWETPDKGKTWTFHLSDNYLWHDDQVLTSHDINYEFLDVEIDRPDASTIVFKLQEPFSPFPSIVSKPIFRVGLLGTGEWSVEKLSLAGNNVSKLVLKDPKGNKKVFKFYPTEQRTKLAFKLGEVDAILEIFEPNPFDAWSTALTKENIDNNKTVTLFYNTLDANLSEKSLRQALTYAIDKKTLGSARSISPMSKGSWAYNSKVKTYEYNPERARKIISEIEKDRGELEIKLVSAPILLTTAEEIEKYWEEVGVKTTIQVSSVIPEDFEIYLAIFDMPIDPDQYAVWHSTQNVSNISNYSSPRIDKLLEDGRIELVVEERKKIYLDFQRFLLEDLPAAFLYYPSFYTIQRK